MAGRTSTNNKSIYIDTGIFLAFLKNEQRDPSEVQGMVELFEGVDNGKVTVCVSDIIYTEIIPIYLPAEVYNSLKFLLLKENIVRVAADSRICQLAGQLRGSYNSQYNKQGITLGTPDAIHLATAIDAKCSTFYTFDGSDGSLQRNGELKLIPLSYDFENKYQLKIMAPYSDSSRCGKSKGRKL